MCGCYAVEARDAAKYRIAANNKGLMSKMPVALGLGNLVLNITDFQCLCLELWVRGVSMCLIN